MIRFCCAFLLTVCFGLNNPFAQTGPAGVGATNGLSNLRYWINADNGRVGASPITTWNDLSGNNVVNAINGNPAFIASVLNGRGVIRFDGVGDQVATNMSINAIAHPAITIFAVYVPRISLSGSVWGEDNGEWDRFQTDINLVATLNASVGAGYDPGSTAHPCTTIANLFSPGVATISNVVYDEDVFNQSVVRVNGSTAAAFTSNASDYQTTGYSNFHVGAIGSNGFTFDGDIAELLVYNGALNITEQILVENYLSAKYNIPLQSADIDVYRQDDNGFDFDVAGIGTINNFYHLASRGSGIITINNATDLDDEEYLMWGHNNGVVQATNVADVPGSVIARSNRIWAVSENDISGNPVNVGSVDIRFDLTGLGSVTASHLRLLIDTDADGMFADELAISGAVSLGNNEYLFVGVALVDGFRFTIATANSQTPLPIELLEFTATEVATSHTVLLNWKTLTEYNNDRFEILRADKSLSWKTIATVKANVNSTLPMHYLWTDVHPYPGTSYYRIRQVDLDGENSYSEVAVVDLLDESSSVFPNPATNTVFISVSGLGLFTWKILSMSGIDYTAMVTKIFQSEDVIEADITRLPDGVYFIVMPAGVQKFLKNTDAGLR
jgi:hypothetical protein